LIADHRLISRPLHILPRARRTPNVCLLGRLSRTC
jgi:hypothetical protein